MLQVITHRHHLQSTRRLGWLSLNSSIRSYSCFLMFQVHTGIEVLCSNRLEFNECQQLPTVIDQSFNWKLLTSTSFQSTFRLGWMKSESYYKVGNCRSRARKLFYEVLTSIIFQVLTWNEWESSFFINLQLMNFFKHQGIIFQCVPMHWINMHAWQSNVLVNKCSKNQ